MEAGWLSADESNGARTQYQSGCDCVKSEAAGGRRVHNWLEESLENLFPASARLGDELRSSVYTKARVRGVSLDKAHTYHVDSGHLMWRREREEKQKDQVKRSVT